MIAELAPHDPGTIAARQREAQASRARRSMSATARAVRRKAESSRPNSHSTMPRLHGALAATAVHVEA
jgi:hypothetical protein